MDPIDLVDYLAFESVSEIRHEYAYGYMHAMVGGSMRHNRISGNIHSASLQRTASTPWQASINDMKQHVQTPDSVYYPDVFVLRGAGLAGERNSASDATLVVQVLSSSTAGTDCRGKQVVYRKLPRLRSYWIVSQDERRVELHAREDDGRGATTEDDSTVDPIVYQKGVAPCPAIVLHQSADLYPKPKVFLSERFLQRKFAPHERNPVGGGNRACPGQVCALDKMKVVLTTLFTERRMRRPPWRF